MIMLFYALEDIIISDEIIMIYNEYFYKDDIRHKITLYEFKHIQGKFRAYKTKEELEKVLKLI